MARTVQLMLGRAPTGRTRTLRACAAAMLLAVAQAAMAIQPSGGVAPPHPGPIASETIERGGTVGGVDVGARSILVDGVVYTVPVGSVRIHFPPNRISTSLADLKRGMQIRFTSQKNFGAPRVQVLEIWVTDARAR
jgi:hypothetical protein